MKINRHGKAKILTQSEIQEIFNEGFQSDRDRALFGVCLYTACRINEASTLNTQDFADVEPMADAETVKLRSPFADPRMSITKGGGKHEGDRHLISA